MRKELFFALALICIATHIIRTIYEILKHRQIIVAGKMSFVIIFSNMMILWISWILLCRYDIYKIDFPGIIRYSGISLAFVGLILFLSGLFTIKTLENYDGDLITSGIYSVLRHPMYTGFLLWLIGFPIFFGALSSLILSVLFIANILFWRYLEEKELEKRFPSYPDFKRKTLF
jgi:protein-S-isoprenylcysteine O-methyltransferase Ste14